MLGPLEVVEDGRTVHVTAPKLRQVLSLFILRRNSFVKLSEIVDELWPGNPPASAVSTAQTYVYKVRKLLARHGAAGALRSRPGGYLLAVPDTGIDLHAFEAAMDRGRAFLDQSEPAAASQTLAGGLALWRGPALADVTCGELLSAYLTRIEELRLLALELRIEADLRLGRHLELLSELKSLVVAYPLHERFHISLMTALHHAGRRSEALGVYAALRRAMVDGLGLEPGEEVRQLHHELLSAEPAGGQDPGHRPVAPALLLPPSAPDRITAPPAQLPHDIADFTGRARDLRRLTEALTAQPGSGTPRTATPMAVLTGPPGSGTTALAVHTAHRLRPSFPDGQLYADLGGSGTTPCDTAGVLAGLLRSLGVPDGEIPGSIEERSGLFRSTTAGRRLLLVLDDAGTAEEIRPLLPGDPSCAVLITGHRRIHGLPGALHLALEPLDPAEGLALLERAIGPERVEREPRAAAELVRLSSGLPLALRCVAGRLAIRPGEPLHAAAERLRGAPDLSAEFRFGTFDVRSRYEACYRKLGSAEQRLVRMLGMFPRKPFTAETAAGLLGWETPIAERAMEALLDSHLLDIESYGPSGESRYVFPVFVWHHARQHVAAPLPRPAGRPLLSALPSATGQAPPTGRVLLSRLDGQAPPCRRVRRGVRDSP